MDKTATRLSACMSEAERMLEQFQAVDPETSPAVEAPVIGPVAAEGDLVNISGRSGCGKTSLIADIVLGWVLPDRKQQALGGLVKVSRTYAATGKVAIIDGENTITRWASILRRKCEAEGLPSFPVASRVQYVSPAALLMRDPRHWKLRSAALGAALDKLGIRLVVFDSLARIWAPTDVNQTDWVQQGLTIYRDVCKRLGITTIAVSHTRRNVGGDDGQLTGPIGSSMQEAQVDAQIMMTMDKDGLGCRLKLHKSRRAFWIRSGAEVSLKFTPQLGYEPQANWASIWPHEPPEDLADLGFAHGMRHQIVRLLEDSGEPSMLSTALAAQLRCTSRTVTNHLRALEADGRIQRLGDGRSTTWRLVR